MKRITRYFIEGLIFLIPVAATIYVIGKIFLLVDGIFKFDFIGLGFIVTLLVITVIGFIASNLVTQRLVGLIDRLFSKLPLVKMIYSAVKDLIGAFVGDKKGFNKPVTVTLVPGSNVNVLGFITAESLEHFGIKDKVAVYLPQSYNFAGNLIVVPLSQVSPIEADSGDLMAFIVSGGISK